MNDFDARARSAARAVHELVASGDASADAPTVDTVAVPPRKRHTMRALLAAAAVVLVAAIVGGVIVTNKDDGPTAAEVTAFCGAVTRAMNDTNGLPNNVVDLAPAEIRADAEAVARNADIPENAGTERLRTIETSGGRFLAWIETNCYPAAAQPGAAPADQRFAPVPLPDGTRPCFVTNGNSIVSGSSRRESSRVTVYGETQRTDPWSGPLVALVVGHDAEQILVEHQPVEVPGVGRATSGMIVDPSYQPIPGTRGITWTDESAGGDSVAVLARNGSTVDLPTLAGQVVHEAATYRLPDPPAGMTQIYDGDLPQVTSSPLGDGLGTTFAVSAGPESPTATAGFGDGGLWSGAVGGQPRVDVTRLLLADPTTRTIGDRTVLEWSGNPMVDEANTTTTARWAEPGGVVLTAAVTGADARDRQQKITALVSSMQKLDRTQWTDLTAQFSYCGMLTTLGRATSSGSADSGRVESTGTSSTTAVAETPTTTTAP